jgi:hypothetical protein
MNDKRRRKNSTQRAPEVRKLSAAHTGSSRKETPLPLIRGDDCTSGFIIALLRMTSMKYRDWPLIVTSFSRDMFGDCLVDLFSSAFFSTFAFCNGRFVYYCDIGGMMAHRSNPQLP